jgi:hypothetical protein
MLAAILDALLPGDDQWPPARETHVATFVSGGALDAVCDVLPPDFASLDIAARSEALRVAEARLPDAFAQLVTEAYRGYYTDPRVLALIERKTGYPARPPQPLGRTVRAADWSILADRAIAPAPLPALLDSLGDPHDS